MHDSNSLNRRTALKHLGLATLIGTMLRDEALLADEPVSALPAGHKLQDQRFGELRDLDSYFPFEPPTSPQQWQQRAEYVRRRILVANGLWPMPPTEPIEAVVHGPVEREGYTVERVYFQSTPGLYVTGSLYRPAGAISTNATGGDTAKKWPTILCPHGHWSNGRFFDHGESAVRAELESGAEKFPVSGRYPLQARCVQLARMGCLVFHYDMIGYADSAPLTGTVGHGLGQQRENLKSPDHWGMFSAQAELRLINVLGLQTFNSIRVLDWITSLPEVDAARIGVTGASGGGTQTFMLAAVDQRPAAAFPAVMVSTAMQGGCTCENACYLRIDTGNIEFAALCAPRPLGMTAANDWTRELETKGLPELKQLYEMLGAADRLEGKYYDFGHNYNYVSRAMMYEFFNKHLQLGQTSPIIEQDFVPLSREELTVWTDQHPKPACDEAAEVQLMRSIDERWQKQFASLVPGGQEKWKSFQAMLLGALDIMIGRPLPKSHEVQYESVIKEDKGSYRRFAGLLRNSTHGEELPSLFLLPKDWKGQVVLWIDGGGKATLLDAHGEPRAEIARLLAGGHAVGSVDLLYTGEATADGQPLTETRRVDNRREIAAYTLGYNHPLFAQRVHDVLNLITFARHHPWGPQQVHLVGTGGAGSIVAAACAQAGSAVNKLALDSAGYRFATITEIRDVNLWPGAVKYGDVPGIIAACAPRALWLAGEGEKAPQLVAACYGAAGGGAQVTSYAGPAEQLREQLVTWLLA